MDLRPPARWSAPVVDPGALVDQEPASQVNAKCSSFRVSTDPKQRNDASTTQQHSAAVATRQCGPAREQTSPALDQTRDRCDALCRTGSSPPDNDCPSHAQRATPVHPRC